jgi:antitoxin component of MazEF toxin-antitoxin module
MITLVLLLSAAFIIPHLLVRQLQYEHENEIERHVAWAIYSNLQEVNDQLEAERAENEALRYEISSTHRIAKRISK